MNNITNSYSLIEQDKAEGIQLKILQASTPVVTEGKAQAGKILNSLTGELYDSVQLLLIGVRQEFRVWNSANGLAKYPEYCSDDMKNLLHLNPETGKKIGEEPLENSKAWMNRIGNPNAKTQYYFLAAMPGNKVPVYFRITGLGYSRAQQFLNQARQSKKQLYEFITRIVVEQQQTKYGIKFVPVFQITDVPMPKDYRVENASAACKLFIQKSSHAQPALAQG